MRTTLTRQLRELAEQRRAARGTKEPPRAVMVALALLPLRRLFAATAVSSKIKEFVYTFS